MSKEDASGWKKKYFTSLEDLELREKQLAETESVMRHSLTRLSLAAAGIDASLDEQLEKFRKQLRSGADKVQLQRLIEGISETVKHIDRKQTRASKAKSEPRGKVAESEPPATVRTSAASGKIASAVKNKKDTEPASASEGLLMVADVLGRQGVDTARLDTVRELVRNASSEQQLESAAGKLVALVISGIDAPTVEPKGAAPVAPARGATDVPRVLLQLLENIQVITVGVQF